MQWRQAREFNTYIDRVEEKLKEGKYEDHEKVREWIEWARGHAESIDPLNDCLPRLLQFDDFKSCELR